MSHSLGVSGSHAPAWEPNPTYHAAESDFCSKTLETKTAGRDMKRFIVSDILGCTDALNYFADRLSGQIEIIDPYNERTMGFSSEAEAYEYFVSHIGLENYRDTLLSRIEKVSEPLTLLGFSIGASAIWSISDRSELENVSGGLGFYGSQIRAAKLTNPKFPIKLVFPKTEKHFEVTDLVKSLSKKQNTEVTQTRYKHGFMNRYSQNFDPKGYDAWTSQLTLLPKDKCFSQIEFFAN